MTRPSSSSNGMPSQLWRYTLGVAVVWTALMVLALTWSVIEHRHTAEDEARLQAEVGLQKDSLLRLWATALGAIYVPETNHLPPSLRLAHGDVPIITTTSGDRLTLVNPMAMTRQLMELGHQLYGQQGHMTSLDPLRPENAPDAWEAAALRAFEKGQTEVSSLNVLDGQPVMRVMRPIIAEKSCLACHGDHDLKVGDIRGGISIAVPMVPVWAASRHQMVSVATCESLIWLLGLAAIGYSARRADERQAERARNLAALRASETRYRVLFEQAAVGVAKLEPATGRFVHVNQKFCALVGYTPEELERMDCQMVTHPDDLVASVANLARLKEGGIRDFILEQRFIHKDGSTVWCNLTVSPLLSPAGQPDFYLAVVQDIMARKHAEDALRESEERYRALIENLGEGIGVVNPSELFTFVNPAADHIFGVPRGNLLGRSLGEFTSGDQFDRIREETTVHQGGKPSVYEFEIRRPSGEARKVLLTAVPQFDRDGKFVGTFGVFRDITERRQAEETLREKNVELLAALANVKSLSGLLPICAACKNIRDDKNYWHRVETYISKNSEATFTHGLCPDCLPKYFPSLDESPPGGNLEGSP